MNYKYNGSHIKYANISIYHPEFFFVMNVNFFRANEIHSYAYVVHNAIFVYFDFNSKEEKTDTQQGGRLISWVNRALNMCNVRPPFTK